VRTTDNGLPVDTSDLDVVTTFGPLGPSVVVNGAVELANIVAVAPAAEACFARKWLSFALGRDVGDSDAAVLDQLGRQFTDAGFDIKELIVDTLTSDSFLGVPVPP
jgi:hypothetical protein